MSTACADSINTNDVAGNQYGIYANGAGTSTADAISLTNNTVRENSAAGIVAYNDTFVTGNFVFNNVSGDGIQLGGATATGNFVHDNSNGFNVISSYSATITGNHVYHNSGIGIHIFNGTIVQGNDVYNNAVGIQSDMGYYYGWYFSGTISNNLVYANSGTGIVIHYASGAYVANNTVYQPTGDAVDIADTSQYVSLRNNILWTQNGYDLNVNPDSEVGISSDFNDLYATGNGAIGLWEGLLFH